MRRTLVIIAILFNASAAFADDTPDWKFAGAITAGTEKAEVDDFYLASRIRFTANKHVQVWTKALRNKDVNEAKLSKSDIESAARKMVAGYIPPFYKVHHTKRSGDIAGAIAFEYIADQSKLKPYNQMLWDIKCDERSARMLTVIGENGISLSQPSAWLYYPPNSLGDDLMTMVCKK